MNNLTMLVKKISHSLIIILFLLILNLCQFWRNQELQDQIEKNNQILEENSLYLQDVLKLQDNQR